MRFLTGNALGHSNTFIARLMCQHRAAHHVANRPNVRQVGLAQLVHGNETALVFCQAHRFGVQFLRIRNAADGDNQFVERFVFFRAVQFVLHTHAFFLFADAFDFHAQLNIQALLFGEIFEGFFGNLLVGGGQEGWRGFQNGHFRTQAFPHRTHFQTNHARTDHAQFGGHFGQVQRAFVVQHVHIVHFHQRQRARHGTGRHNHMFGFDGGFFAFVVDVDLPEIAVFALKRTEAEEAFHFVFLEQEFNAAREFGNNGVFALNHFGCVKVQAACADAVFGKIVLRGMEMFGRLQQGFGRNAAHVQASTAQCRRIARFIDTRIDTRGFETQLRGADGRHITAGARTNDNNVELRHDVFLCK